MEFVPILGVFISGAAALIVAIVQFRELTRSLIVVAYFVFVHIIEGDVVGPRIIASGTEAGQRAVCGGCAERLELELGASDAAACPDCGRHTELCAVMPCGVPSEPRPVGPSVAW